MKKSLRLLMILLTSLTLSSCVTVPETTPIEVPVFNLATPQRPQLEEIPSDSSGAIKALTTNMSKLVSHVESLEVYGEYLKNYYETVIQIITR